MEDKKHDPCEDDGCMVCCVHEFDMMEGGYCLNCGKEGEIDYDQNDRD